MSDITNFSQIELDDRQKKVIAFNSLIHRLPRPNLALLRALSLFLIEIVNNSDVNKMTVRNVGIVFAPTLNIPAPVFSMFLTDFDSIFGEDSGPGPTNVELTVDHSLSPDDVRSPRHQMFSDIPTPSYNQTSFRGSSDAPTGLDHSRAPHEAGFTPMQPSYDQAGYRQDVYNQPAGASGPFSSLNGMLSPSSDDSRSAKSKRRESSMLFMEHSMFLFTALAILCFMLTDLFCSTRRSLLLPRQINNCSTKPTTKPTFGNLVWPPFLLVFPDFQFPDYICPFERPRFARRMTTLPTWHQQSRRECLMIMVIRMRLQYQRPSWLWTILAWRFFLVYRYTPSILFLFTPALCLRHFFFILFLLFRADLELSVCPEAFHVSIEIAPLSFL